jgi:hypothetical protein
MSVAILREIAPYFKLKPSKIRPEQNGLLLTSTLAYFSTIFPAFVTPFRQIMHFVAESFFYFTLKAAAVDFMHQL